MPCPALDHFSIALKFDGLGGDFTVSLFIPSHLTKTKILCLQGKRRHRDNLRQKYNDLYVADSFWPHKLVDLAALWGDNVVDHCRPRHSRLNYLQ